MSDVLIRNMRAKFVPMERSDILASFDAFVAGFHIRQAQIRKSHQTGEVFAHIRTGGASQARIGITLPHGPVRDAICEAALAAYDEEHP